MRLTIMNYRMMNEAHLVPSYITSLDYKVRIFNTIMISYFFNEIHNVYIRRTLHKTNILKYLLLSWRTAQSKLRDLYNNILTILIKYLLTHLIDIIKIEELFLTNTQEGVLRVRNSWHQILVTLWENKQTVVSSIFTAFMLLTQVSSDNYSS